MEEALEINDKLIDAKSTRIYKNEVASYEQLMQRRFGGFTRKSPFLVKGDFENIPCWLLYVCVIQSEIEGVVEKLASVSRRFPFSIAIPEDSQVASHLLEGKLSLIHSGKLIMIKREDESQANELAKALVELTDQNNGPEIENGFYLGGRIYTQYESPVFYPLTAMEQHPKPVIWPYTIKQRISKKANARRIGKYLLIHELKNDVKGSVHKCISIKNWLNIQWCVIKQGKAYRSLDEFGRDIRDRLKWQFEVHERLKELDILPNAYDLFEHSSDWYFVMDYVKGTSYHQFVSEVQEGTIYKYLVTEKQMVLINRAMEMLQLIACFHQYGLLHRDISPMNFIVEENQKIRAIDVELSYDLSGQGIHPWFTLGTEGYMSVQQRNLLPPEVEDDIYGLGGILIFTFTGIAPSKFETLELEADLFEHINYFIGDQRVSTMIAACRSADPCERPALDAIIHNLDLYRAKLLTNNIEAVKQSQTFKVTREQLSKSVGSFSNLPPISLNPNKLVYDATNCSFDSGIAGVLYSLSVADKIGIDYSIAKETFPDLLQILVSEVGKTNVSDLIGPGLMNGRFGIAIILALLIKQSLVENHIDRFNLIASLLNAGNLKPGVYDGVAGHGLAMMKSAELLNFPNLCQNVPEMAKFLISRQNKDGSWDVERTPAEKKNVQLTGLFHGVAGIVYFLIVAHHKFYDCNSKMSAERGLLWLADQRKNDKRKHLMPISSESDATDPWIEAGFTGVAFVFLKAYEFWKVQEYKEIAESLLAIHPIQLTSNYNSFANGLAGIGEVYLEAYRIFQKEEYYERANRIAEFLMHSNCTSEVKGMYWLDGNDDKPVPGFVNGNAGILHFLTRLYLPTKVEFPLIDFRP